MNKTTEAALREKKLAQALNLIAMKESDMEDTTACINDMKKHASLTEDEARIVAAAVRAKYVPNVASKLGLNKTTVAQAMGLPVEDNDHADFADDGSNDMMGKSRHHSMPDMQGSDLDGGEMGGLDAHPTDSFALPTKNDDESNDLGEANDANNTATIKIEVPADQLDAVTSAIEEALSKVLGDGSDSSEDPDLMEEGGSDNPAPDFMKSEDKPEEEGDGDDFMADKGGKKPQDAGSDEPEMHTAKTKVNTMNKEALASRRAERDAILAKSSRTVIAEDGTKPKDIGLGKDTTEGTYGGEKAKPYQFNSDAQYHGEDEYPVMTLKDGEGNSLRKDNPTFEKQSIPTNNPDNLQLKDSYNAMKLTGSPDGTLDYTVDFEHLDDVPSGEGRDGSDFEVPTQMGAKPRKMTVAKVVECQGCNNPTRVAVNAIDCEDCNTRIAICEDCETEGYCPSCAAHVKQASTEDISKVEFSSPAKEVKSAKTEDDSSKEVVASIPVKDFEIFKARFQTAYSVSTKLALAGILDPSEVDANVAIWMNDGLQVTAMQTQGNLMLRSAKNSAERVASAAADRMNVRTSQVGISTNPAFVGQAPSGSPYQQDLQTALSGLFTMPRFEDSK